jgi:hypothetical protein
MAGTVKIVHVVRFSSIIHLSTLLPTEFSLFYIPNFRFFTLFFSLKMLCEGQLFYSFKALQHAVEEWALRENFTTRTPLKDNKRVEYRCYQHASHGCPFRIFATWKNDAVGIRKLEPLHTCFAVATPKYSHVNTQEWLQREVPKLLRVTKETTPKQIVEAVQFRYGETVQYQAALDCRNDCHRHT